MYSRFDAYNIQKIKSEKIANAILDQSVLTPGLINKNIKQVLNSNGKSFDINSKKLSTTEVESLNKIDESEFLEAFIKLQNDYYTGLNDEKYGKYKKGWLNRTERLK